MRRAFHAATLALLAMLPSVAVAAQPPEGPRGYLGVSVDRFDDIPELADLGDLPKLAKLPEHSGLEAEAGGRRVVGVVVESLMPGAAGERAGLEVGDVILAIDGQPFNPEGTPAREFADFFRERPPGEVHELLVLNRALETEVRRGGATLPDPLPTIADLDAALDGLKDGEVLEVSARRQAGLEKVVVELGLHPLDGPPARELLADRQTHGHLLDDVSQVELFARQAIEHYGLEADVQQVSARLAAVGDTDLGHRLDDVRFVHRNPWKVGAAAADLLGALAGEGADVDLDLRIRAAAARDRLDLTGVSFEPLPVAVSVEEHLAALDRLLTDTTALVADAFALLDPEERSFLAAHWVDVGKALQDHVYLDVDGPLRRRRVLRILELAEKVDRRQLMAAGLSWSRLADPRWLAALPGDLTGVAAVDGPLRRATRFGDIVIGGRGDDTYRGVEPAIVIDLGGDDVYSNNAGSSSGLERPAAAVIDLGGDDDYAATTSPAQGAGVGGVGLLIDLAGNDRYLGIDWAQGVGVLGVGALIDGGGDDVYRAQHLSQAVGLWGAGFLIDRGGSDRYELLHLGQGLGLPSGFGVLHEGGGADHYHAKGGAPTNYGTPGVFDAWAQGTGMGFRMLQEGGIGILADDGGADAYEAGNFSQGGGYFYGLGLLHDRGRDDDSYIGSRYNQGYAAHQAVGTFIEDGGDDTYITRDGVIGGLAWDECVSYFHDRSGDDTYRAGFFSLAASAHQAFAIFVDESGSDTYSGASPSAATADELDRSSFSLFLDLGKGKDTHAGGLAEGEIRLDGSNGIAADLPQRLDSLGNPLTVERNALPRPTVAE